MFGDAAGNADARAKHADDERITLPDHFEFAADAKAHRHETLDGHIRGIDAMHNGARAGGDFVEFHLGGRKVVMYSDNCRYWLSLSFAFNFIFCIHESHA
jgi:hypothetical protein